MFKRKEGRFAAFSEEEKSIIAASTATVCHAYVRSVQEGHVPVEKMGEAADQLEVLFSIHVEAADAMKSKPDDVPEVPRDSMATVIRSLRDGTAAQLFGPPTGRVKEALDNLGREAVRRAAAKTAAKAKAETSTRKPVALRRTGKWSVPGEDDE